MLHGVNIPIVNLKLTQSKFDIFGSSRERNNIPDIAYPGKKHQKALKPKAEAAVRNASVLPGIKIPETKDSKLNMVQKLGISNPKWADIKHLELWKTPEGWRHFKARYIR